MVIKIATNTKKINNKLSAFEQELVDTIKKISEYKTACEANIVSIIYLTPDSIYDNNLTLDEFNNNIWRVYWTIANDIVMIEKKTSLDEITVGLYLEKHPKLKAKYDEYGGYDTIVNAGAYVKIENLYGYIQELRKWNCIIKLAKKGYPVKDRLSDYCDMEAEDIYNEWEAMINNIFVNIDKETKSYNAFDNIYELIDEMNNGKGVGLPLYNAPILTREIGGLNSLGNIYGLGANSGVGKSTMTFNYIIPSAIQYDEKVVMMINEEDEQKVRKELLIWVANNIFKEELHKYVLRDGNFNEKTIELLNKCAEWIEAKKDSRILTIIPLEKYSVNIATKIIKKYAALGVKIFVLDTLKESFDAKTDEIFKSMMRDMVVLYDVVKPSAKNVGLWVTYQLGKNSLLTRHLTNANIGQAKSIVDVMSVNLMMRRPFDDEYEGEKHELKCYKLEGKNGKTKIPFKLKKDKKYMITFINKNRFGSTDAYQIVSECDLSTNTYKDVGICIVHQDW